ncbi:MAG: dienelactone hydrolase [Pedosphaera sp.]|nr:dienelactone hydrolase [Pedosphaera sp.]
MGRLPVAGLAKSGMTTHMRFPAAAAFATLLTVTLMAQEKSNADLWIEALRAAPELKVPATRAAWDQQRAATREHLWRLLGDLPSRPKVPKVETLSREERDGYTLEKFRFDNGAGAMVPGYLLLPKERKKSPAVLYCHWHGGQYEIGKEELFRTNAVPVAPGPALAKLGYVVMGIDAYCFGERNGAGPGGPAEKGGAGEMTAAKFQLWAGRSLWGMIVRDDLMALDYLCSRKEVDAARVAVTGISMGATRTWWITAMDDRPRTGIAVACLTRYSDLVRAEGLKYHGIYYFVPGLLKHFDTEAIVALAAPRPMLFMTGDLDLGSPLKGIQTIEAKVRPIYKLTGRETDFQNIVYPKLGHVYTPEMWDKTRLWLAEKLAK